MRKNKYNNIIKIITFVLFFIIFPKKTQAIPPPEIISSMGTFFGQAFSLFSVLIISLFFYIKNFFQGRPLFIFFKIIALISLIACCSYFTAYYFDEKNKLVQLETQYNEYNKILIEQLEEKKLEEETGKKNEYNKRSAEEEIIYKINRMKEEGVNLKSLIEAKKLYNITNNTEGIPEISVEAFKEILDNFDPEKYIIYDVRGVEGMWYDSGHIIHSRYWDNKDKSNQEREEFAKKMAENIDDDKIVIFYCDFGVASVYIAKKFIKYHKNTFYFNDYSHLALKGYFSNNFEKYNPACGEILKEDKAQELIKKGATLVDPRPKEEYEKEPLLDSINISFYEESSFEEALAKFEEAGAKNGIITFCYDNYSCNYACYTNVMLNEWLGRKFGFSYGILPLDNYISDD